MNNKEDSLFSVKVYSEVNDFITLIGDKNSSKIPKDIRDFFKRNADEKHKYIDIRIPLENQNIEHDTYVIIAHLYLKYICDDIVEKEKLKSIYFNNLNQN